MNNQHHAEAVVNSHCIINTYNSLCCEMKRFHADSKEPGDREKPQTQAPHDELIAALLESPDLKGWERSYALATRNTKRRSDKQIQKIKAIATRLGISEGGSEV
jgi:hypothetical protein